jgi:GNAT superfamily N-acetyltransferase
MSQPTIAPALTVDEIRRCYPVMHELRPHLAEAAFVEQVQRQQASAGYALVFLEVDHAITALAGYRIAECLAWGRYLYVDDLVTAARRRSQGDGRRLFAWLVAQARATACAQLHLDSGVQRFGAHRFYLQQRLDLTCHHFSMLLR